MELTKVDVSTQASDSSVQEMYEFVKFFVLKFENSMTRLRV